MMEGYGRFLKSFTVIELDIVLKCFIFILATIKLARKAQDWWEGSELFTGNIYRTLIK